MTLFLAEFLYGLAEKNEMNLLNFLVATVLLFGTASI